MINLEVTLNSTGLITDYSYSDPTSSPAGALLEVSLQNGSSGTPVPQESYTYVSNTDSSSLAVYQFATDTVFRDDAGDIGEETSYSYTYFSGTNQIETLTTTLPTVTTAQNGSGTAAVTVSYFNRQGQTTWTRDANGAIGYTAYDPATGAIIKQVNDVNTADIADTAESASLPSGWSTVTAVTGYGNAQTTTYQVDALGRTTEETDPNGNVTLTIFDDPHHESRTYAGYEFDDPYGYSTDRGLYRELGLRLHRNA